MVLDNIEQIRLVGIEFRQQLAQIHFNAALGNARAGTDISKRKIVRAKELKEIMSL